MSEGIAIQERGKRAIKNCQHRWVIETPHGATSRGHCRRCGATKRFPNALEQPIGQFAGGGPIRAGRVTRETLVSRPGDSLR